MAIGTDDIEKGVRLAERMTLRTLAKLVLIGIACVAVWSLWERRAEVTNALFSSISAMIVLILIVVGLIAYLGLDGMIRDAERRADEVQRDLQRQIGEYRARLEAQEQRILLLQEAQARETTHLQQARETLIRIRRFLRDLVRSGAVERASIPDSILGDLDP